MLRENQEKEIYFRGLTEKERQVFEEENKIKLASWEKIDAMKDGIDWEAGNAHRWTVDWTREEYGNEDYFLYEKPYNAWNYAEFIKKKYPSSTVVVGCHAFRMDNDFLKNRKTFIGKGIYLKVL